MVQILNEFHFWWYTNLVFQLKEVIGLFRKERLEKEQNKYNGEANELINNQKKLKGLLHNVIKKGNEKKGTLGEAWDKLQLFVELIKAYSKGEYRDVTKSTIITVIGALLYFVSPLDLVPDFIIGIGIIDDAAVIGYTIKKLSGELDAFSQWKNTNSSKLENPFE